MNTLIKNKTGAFGTAGDFWYRQMSETAANGAALARSLARAADANNAISKMSKAVAALSGNGTVLTHNITVAFKPADVRLLNFDPSQRFISGSYPQVTVTRPVKYSLDRTGAIQIEGLPADLPSPEAESLTANVSDTVGDNDFGTLWFRLEDTDRVVLLDTQEARPLYFVPLPFQYTPITLSSADADLTVGTSFIAGKGYILLYDDPRILFPDNILIIKSASVNLAHVMDYTYQVDNVMSDGRYIAAYMRATHSAAALKLALAEVAGLPIVHEESVLQNIYELYSGVIYEFDTQILNVPSYIEHTPLIVGTTYPAGTIVGNDYIKIYSSDYTAHDPWYREGELEEEWSANGLDLSSISPFQSVIVPDSVGTFALNGTQSGGTAQLRLNAVTGGNTAAYWNFVKAAEQTSGKFIADVSGVTAGATANCIDFYFSNMLAYNAIIIKLRTQELGSEKHQNVISFIKRDLPIHVTPIILNS